MRKIIMGIPLVLLIALVSVIAWANLTPNENVVTAEKTGESGESVADYVATAWDHWDGGSNINEENIDMDMTFIAIRQISDLEDETNKLGMEEDFKELQDLANPITGEFGRLSESEKDFYYQKFEDKLFEIHSTLN